MLIKELTLARGISGDESEIRDVIKNHISEYVDEITRDTMGNLYAVKKGKQLVKKIMITAHMDEVGYMVTAITDSGMLKISPVGMWMEDGIIASKKVLVGNKKIPGIVGMKPIHLQEPEERKKRIKIGQLFIDIGCSTKQEAEKLVSRGDYVYYDSDFVEMENGLIKAKALDDRVGCAVLIEVLKENYDLTIQGCFTVQEEIGMRGAGVAANRLKPDIAIVLEGTTCSDVPETDQHEMVTRIGNGPAITIADKHVYSNKGLVKELLETAKQNNIKIQIKEGIYGGTDAAKIQASLEGVPTAVVSVPCRYIHSPSSVMSIKDMEETVKLVKAYLRKIEKE